MNFKGFSLIELLIVLTVIAILTAISLPSLTTLKHQTHATALLQELERAIALAQKTAQIEHVPVKICGSDNLQTCANHWQPSFIVLVRNKIIYSSKNPFATGVLHWRSFQTLHPYLIFSPHNVIDGENGTFWYCEKGMSNPLWGLALNKAQRRREMRADKLGRIVDHKGHLLLC